MLSPPLGLGNSSISNAYDVVVSAEICVRSLFRTPLKRAPKKQKKTYY
jgi:hypothetical protein